MCKGKSAVTLGARIHKCSERPHVVRGVCLEQRVAAAEQGDCNAAGKVCMFASMVTCHTNSYTSHAPSTKARGLQVPSSCCTMASKAKMSDA